MTAPWEVPAIPTTEQYEGTPEPATVVDAPQVPAVSTWSWDTNKIVIAALGVIGVGFAVYFVLQYNGAKAAHLAAGAGSDG